MLGERLGPYRIESELGSGGMGTVYAAFVEGDVPGLGAGTRVALKVLHRHLPETNRSVERFRREIAIGREVAHPNVVRTIGGDVQDGRHFLAMEYVAGQTLRELLHELRTVPEELCRHIGREIAQGLAAIHAAGAVHRDMKPENVLITPVHVVKIMDLGVARMLDEAARLSVTGTFAGSLHYAAPEQLLGGSELDGRADLHALGLVLYELACGVNPYDADQLGRVVHKVLNEQPRRLGAVNPQFSAFYEETVHTLLAKSRDDRFASARDVVSVLRDGEGGAWWRSRVRDIREVTHRPLRRMRIPRETAVHGREDELAALRECFDVARSGEGRVVLVDGEAGVGKSRLVDEFVARLHASGEDFNFLYGGYPPGGAATGIDAFSAAFREQLGDAGCAAYLSAAPVLVPAFDAALRGEPTPERAQPLTRESLQTCFVHATRALAAERPTVIVIDDVHFAPDAGRALFAAVAMSVPAHAVLLVATSRPGVAAEWVADVTRLDHARHVTLPRLGPKDLARLLKESLRSTRAARELGVQIGLKSDGNPFFVFEILRGLREGRVITRAEDGSWSTTRRIEDIEIPSSVRDLVNARVASLDQDDRDVLDLAACRGYEFDPTLLADVLGVARIPLLKQLAQIERRHRVVRSRGRQFVFDHHQIRDALYATLPELLREEYHAALGDALESRAAPAGIEPAGDVCVDLCDQFLRGGRGESSLRYFDAALSHLATGHDSARAAALAERALAVPGLLTGRERIGALLRLTEFADMTGRRDRQLEAGREAQALAETVDDDALRADAAQAVGTCLWRTSRLTEARAELERALSLRRRLGDRRGEALATGTLGLVLWYEGRQAEARDHHERHAELAREIGDVRSEARAIGNLGNVLGATGDLGGARSHFERALALARDTGSREGEAAATGSLGVIFLRQGQLRQAAEHHGRDLAICREIGDRRGEATATGNVGNVLFAERRLREAREQHEAALALADEIGDRRGATRATGNLANVLSAEGRPRQAREMHGKFTLPLENKIIRTTKIKHPKGYLDPARPFLDDSRSIAQEDLAFEYMLNRLRLFEPIPFAEFTAYTGLPLSAVEPEIEHALAKKLLTKDATSWQVTALGHRYLNELLTLFMD